MHTFQDAETTSKDGCAPWLPTGDFETAMRIAGFVIALFLCSSVLVADDHNIDFDKSVDFSKINTFMVRNGKINSGRAELNNSLVLKKIGDMVRMMLTSKGMQESSGKPDVIVDFNASGLDYAIGPGRRANVVAASRGDATGRGRGRGESGQPVDFSEGTLVIDVTTTQTPPVLIWRGVYNDKEKNSAKLAEKFPDDAKKLLSEFPRKKK
jgi:hypothetical protein